MKSTCDWCRNDSAVLKTYEVFGIEYNICEKCLEAHEKGVCIECGEPLDDDVALNGKCSGCQQISEARTEKKRYEESNGLGSNALDDLTNSEKMTEDDFNSWLTFGQGNFSPETRATNRHRWISEKISNDLHWSEKDIKNNK